jgi:hypothetical protein
MSFLKLVDFYFLEKWNYRGYILVRQKKMEIFEDLCLPYSDAALSYVTGYR